MRISNKNEVKQCQSTSPKKAKLYQAIDEIIASGRKLKWNQIISELNDVYDIKTSRTSFFRDIEELEEKYGAPIDTDFETSGYFYTDPKYRLPRFYTDENAAKAAKLIKTLMDMVKETKTCSIFDLVRNPLVRDSLTWSGHKLQGRRKWNDLASLEVWTT